MVSVHFLLPLAVFPFGVYLAWYLEWISVLWGVTFCMDFLSGLFLLVCRVFGCVYCVFRVEASFMFVQCLHGCSEMRVSVHEVSFACDLLIFRSSFVSRVLFLASSW